MLPAVGCVTASANAVATAASTAVPPAASINAPAFEASWFADTTIDSFWRTGCAAARSAAGIASMAAMAVAAPKRIVGKVKPPPELTGGGPFPGEPL